MDEKTLAYNTAKAHAQTIVDEMGGVTLGGATIADRFFEKWTAAGHRIGREYDALRHWLMAAGYDNDGRFTIIMSSHFING